METAAAETATRFLTMVGDLLAQGVDEETAVCTAWTRVEELASAVGSAVAMEATGTGRQEAGDASFAQLVG
jgi:hypothetical protein